MLFRSGVVPAGPVVGAVVEVLVTEQASPALLAVTLPRLVAGAVQAARVAHALVAQRALPSQAARALARGFTVPLPLVATRRADGCADRERGRERERRNIRAPVRITKQPPFAGLRHIKYLLSSKRSSWYTHKRNTCRLFFTQGSAHYVPARVPVKAYTQRPLLRQTKDAD